MYLPLIHRLNSACSQWNQDWFWLWYFKSTFDQLTVMVGIFLATMTSAIGALHKNWSLSMKGLITILPLWQEWQYGVNTLCRLLNLEEISFSQRVDRYIMLIACNWSCSKLVIKLEKNALPQFWLEYGISSNSRYIR